MKVNLGFVLQNINFAIVDSLYIYNFVTDFASSVVEKAKNKAERQIFDNRRI